MQPKILFLEVFGKLVYDCGVFFVLFFQSDSPVARQTMEDKRSKSIEEREEQYNKVRERIFNQDVSLWESMLFRSVGFFYK